MLLKDWSIYGDEFTTNVYDRHYDDLVALLFNSQEQTLRVENVTLDLAGVTRLRKKLQEVERYAAKYLNT